MADPYRREAVRQFARAIGRQFTALADVMVGEQGPATRAEGDQLAATWRDNDPQFRPQLIEELAATVNVIIGLHSAVGIDLLALMEDVMDKVLTDAGVL